MDLTTEFSRSIADFLEKAKKDVERKAIEALYEAGEEGVREAVATGNYEDHTGTLRSSIYYEVDEPMMSVTLAAAAPYAQYVERIHNKIVLDKGIRKMNDVIDEVMQSKGFKK